MRRNYRLPAEEPLGRHTSIREDNINIKPKKIL
jgi:hypothetical protein